MTQTGEGTLSADSSTNGTATTSTPAARVTAEALEEVSHKNKSKLREEKGKETSSAMVTENQHVVLPLSFLPNELMLHIFSFIDGAELLKLPLVCSMWRNLLEDPLVWRELFFRTFRLRFVSFLPSITSARRDWKRVYINKLREDYKLSKELSRRFNGTFENTKTFSGSHGEAIFGLCPNEETGILVAGCGSALKIWDMSSGVLLRSIEAHSKPIRDVLCDDDKIISGSLDGTIKITDMESGRVQHTLAEHRSWVLSLAHNIIHIVSGSSDKTIKLWTTANGKCIQTFKEHAGAVRSVDCNSSHILSASVDNTVKLWDYNYSTSVSTFGGYMDAVVKCQFVNENIFWTAAFDSTLMKWDRRSPRAVHSHKLSAPVTCLHADIHKVVFGMWNGSIHVYDAINHGIINTLSSAYGKHREAVNCIHFGTSRVVSGSHDSTIKIWQQQSPSQHKFSLEQVKRLFGDNSVASSGSTVCSAASSSSSASSFTLPPSIAWLNSSSTTPSAYPSSPASPPPSSTSSASSPLASASPSPPFASSSSPAIAATTAAGVASPSSSPSSSFIFSNPPSSPSSTQNMFAWLPMMASPPSPSPLHRRNHHQFPSPPYQHQNAYLPNARNTFINQQHYSHRPHFPPLHQLPSHSSYSQHQRTSSPPSPSVAPSSSSGGRGERGESGDSGEGADWYSSAIPSISSVGARHQQQRPSYSRSSVPSPSSSPSSSSSSSLSSSPASATISPVGSSSSSSTSSSSSSSSDPITTTLNPSVLRTPHVNASADPSTDVEDDVVASAIPQHHQHHHQNHCS